MLEYILDTADVGKIEKCFDIFPLAGVTTNPTIISREKRDFFAILRDIRAIIGPDKYLCAQVLGETYDTIMADADTILKAVPGPGKMSVKIPVSHAGLKAMRELARRGVSVTATAIFTPQQALLAAEAGADYAAPYVNRIDNISGDGVKVVKEIVQLYKVFGLPTKCLAASFKNVQQINECALAGCQSVTVAPDVFLKVAEHPLTDAAINQFRNDWEAFYGKGVKPSDLKKPAE